jgi:hypothetical protein
MRGQTAGILMDHSTQKAQPHLVFHSSDEYEEDMYTNISSIRHCNHDVPPNITAVANSAMTAHPPPFLSIAEAREAITGTAAAMISSSSPSSPNTIVKQMTFNCQKAGMDTAITMYALQCAGIDTNFFCLFSILIFIVLRSPCKKFKPYDNPFWDFNNGGNKKKSGIISKIVATYVYASSQGQRTHSARTKIVAFLSLLRWSHALRSYQHFGPPPKTCVSQTIRWCQWGAERMVNHMETHEAGCLSHTFLPEGVVS